jgi:hypothetical protein
LAGEGAGEGGTHGKPLVDALKNRLKNLQVLRRVPLRRFTHEPVDEPPADAF